MCFVCSHRVVRASSEFYPMRKSGKSGKPGKSGWIQSNANRTALRRAAAQTATSLDRGVAFRSASWSQWAIRQVMKDCVPVQMLSLIFLVNVISES